MFCMIQVILKGKLTFRPEINISGQQENTIILSGELFKWDLELELETEHFLWDKVLLIPSIYWLALLSREVNFLFNFAIIWWVTLVPSPFLNWLTYSKSKSKHQTWGWLFKMEAPNLAILYVITKNGVAL